MSMIISSRKNPLIARYRLLNSDKRVRDEWELFNIEGVRLCEEAVAAGLLIETAFITETAVSKYPETYKKLCEVREPVVITDELGGYIADTKSPQGVFITAVQPVGFAGFDPADNGRYILLDGLQDSGNIGTIIRTADAFGISGVILSPDCADVWSPKVVRGAMGSLFRLPIMTQRLPEFIERLRAGGFSVSAAVLDKDARSIDTVRFSDKCAIVIGNEGNGVSEAVIQAAGSSIYIPIENAESLNAAVAASIFCYEMRNINKK